MNENNEKMRDSVDVNSIARARLAKQAFLLGIATGGIMQIIENSRSLEEAKKYLLKLLMELTTEIDALYYKNEKK
jgi:hypothetical protein